MLNFIRSGNITKSSIISAPVDVAPSKLKWSSWVDNTIIHFKKFEPVDFKSVVVLTNGDRTTSIREFSGSKVYRRSFDEMESLDDIIGQDSSVLVVSYGDWPRSSTSWLDSLNRVGTTAYKAQRDDHLNQQFLQWCSIQDRLTSHVGYTIADFGSRFCDADDVCKKWRVRLARSKHIPEPAVPSWFAGTLVMSQAEIPQGDNVMVDHIKIAPIDWCGDPNWDSRIQDIISRIESDTTSMWISAPFVGMTLDIIHRLRSRFPERAFDFVSPSSVLGFHPIRDRFLYLGTARTNSFFLYFDSQDVLNFVSRTTRA
jgi:hypothetical protein